MFFFGFVKLYIFGIGPVLKWILCNQIMRLNPSWNVLGEVIIYIYIHIFETPSWNVLIFWSYIFWEWTRQPEMDLMQSDILRLNPSWNVLCEVILYVLRPCPGLFLFCEVIYFGIGPQMVFMQSDILRSNPSWNVRRYKFWDPVLECFYFVIFYILGLDPSWNVFAGFHLLGWNTKKKIEHVGPGKPRFGRP